MSANVCRRNSPTKGGGCSVEEGFELNRFIMKALSELNAGLASSIELRSLQGVPIFTALRSVTAQRGSFLADVPEHLRSVWETELREHNLPGMDSNSYVCVWSFVDEIRRDQERGMITLWFQVTVWERQ